MQRYQLYRVSEAGVPLPGHDFTGYNDDDALTVARMMTGGAQAEVWQGARWVGWLNPQVIRDMGGAAEPWLKSR